MVAISTVCLYHKLTHLLKETVFLLWSCDLEQFTVEPVYYGHLGTSQKCPDYQGVLIFQVSLHDNVSFGTTARCVDYAGVHIFKCPD